MLKVNEGMIARSYQVENINEETEVIYYHQMKSIITEMKISLE